VLLGGWAATTLFRPRHALNGLVQSPGAPGEPPESRTADPLSIGGPLEGVCRLAALTVSGL
jgi:hypothetical protein